MIHQDCPKSQCDCGNLDEVHVMINMGLIAMGSIAFVHRCTNGRDVVSCLLNMYALKIIAWRVVIDKMMAVSTNATFSLVGVVVWTYSVNVV